MTAVDQDMAGLLQRSASLLLYQEVLETDAGQSFVALLRSCLPIACFPAGIGEAHGADTHNALDTIQECLYAYGDWFSALATAQQSWADYLINQILQAENPFSQQAQRSHWQDLPPGLITAARHDLRILQQLAACEPQQLREWVQLRAELTQPLPAWDLPTTHTETWLSLADWGEAVADLAATYRQRGCGRFATYRAVRWQSGQFVGIRHPDPVKLDELIGYEQPKQTLLKNTQFLLAGYPALHVLLYGSRGSGKSSLVKALLTEFGDRGLRLIEVSKAELHNLAAIVEQLRELPQKFIVFVDDLSFEEDDDAFKALKVVLEGSLTARPQNVVVYATSNRRHLIREFFGDRPPPSTAAEIHTWDTVEEKLSFSDRFGLTLTFEPANQDTYLEIVRGLATQSGLSLEPADLDFRALQWATRHNGRSGRTARQFIDFLKAEMQIGTD